MILTCRRVGFLFSGALHAALVAAVVMHNPTELRSASPEAPLALNLDMFERPVAGKSVAETEPATTLLAQAKPVPLEPEPALEAPTEPPLPTAQRAPRAKPKPNPVRKKQPPKQVAPPRLVDEPQERTQTTATEPYHRQVDAPKVARTASDSNSIATKQIKASFLAALARQIDREKYYPRSSRRRGEQGTIVVSFVLEKDGRLTHLKVETSSGFVRLDKAALKTLTKVSPFHPIPESLGLKRWSISVPIAFIMRR